MHRLIKKRALFITLFLLLLMITSLISIGLIFSQSDPNTHLVADIYQNGELIKSISLNSVTKNYTINITTTDGGINMIDVSPNSIGICQANCPDQLCVRQGYINTGLLPITCLPHRLVIQIRPSENTVTDTITY